MAPGRTAEDEIKHEIARLERRLREAKARLGASDHDVAHRPAPLRLPSLASSASAASLCSSPSSAHFLLLLSDSALPVGSFAFSSGLESYAAHSGPRAASFSAFLPLSLSSFAATTLPFVLAAHRRPGSLADLDDQLDAAVVCTVGRRASVAQGRALLGIWERSFRPALPASAAAGGDSAQVLKDFSALLRREGTSAAAANNSNNNNNNNNKASAAAADSVPLASAHLGPLFGAICALVGLTLRQTAYVFMLSHVKALISAAVRANMFGPYQAQKLLASEHVQSMINAMIDREWDTPVEEAGQAVPVMDLWIGRHELLYSRIFNS